MILENKMEEDKQLNFTRPLLSVRRFSPSIPSEKVQEKERYNSISSMPRLPYFKSELKSGPVTNPGTVPFMWEQIPGRPKEESGLPLQDSDWPPVAPKLPPGRYREDKQRDSDKVSPGTSNGTLQSGKTPPNPKNFPAVDEKVKNFGSHKEKMLEEGSDSGDADEAYFDALDTLSRTESFFFNCSMSGLTGIDDPDMKASERFRTDSQTREMMMDRFLPAAMAMASEAPQYAPKKHPSMQEQPTQLRNTVSRDKPTLRYGPSFNKLYFKEKEKEDEESDNDNDQHGSLPGVCGLLPGLCLKSSLGRINPIPGMSVRTRAPVSSHNKIKARSLSAASFSEMKNQLPVSDIAEQKPVAKVQAAEPRKDKPRLQKVLTLDEFQRRNLEGSLGSKPSRGYNTSTFSDGLFDSSNEGKEIVAISGYAKKDSAVGYESHKKGFKTFKELLADSDVIESDTGPPIVEKTVYVDTIQKVESPDEKSCSCDIKEAEKKPKFEENDYKIVNKQMDSILLEDSSLKNIKTLKCLDGADMQPDARKFSDLSIVSSIDKLYPDDDVENDEYERSTPAENIEAIRFQKQLVVNPPPSPKPPSDSWLSRTLPSKKALSLQFHLNASANSRNQRAKAQTGESKWETIVRTTKVQNQHWRHSKELLRSIPES